MADRKIIRDLNSLIRFNERKRLKLPAARTAISGETGYALMVVAEPDPETEELLYVSVNIDLDTRHIYSFDKDGGAPVFIRSSEPYVGQIGVNTELGVTSFYDTQLATEMYSGETKTLKIAKNGTQISSDTYATSGMKLNSNSILIRRSTPYIGFEIFDFSGAHIGFMSTGANQESEMLAINDTGVLFVRTDSGAGTRGYSIMDYAGGYIIDQLPPSTPIVAIWLMAAANKYAFFIVSSTTGTGSLATSVFTYNVINNEGTAIATIELEGLDMYTALGGGEYSYINQVVASTDRLYVLAYNRTNFDSVVLAYELTMTLSLLGVATNAVLGELLSARTITESGSGRGGPYGVMDSSTLAI